MANFTLDDIRAAAEAKYGSTEITLNDGFVAVLVNPLRLPKEKREQLSQIQSDESVDQEDMLSNAVRLVAEKPVQAERLLEEVAGDLTVLAQIFESYTKSVQVGEASASQD